MEHLQYPVGRFTLPEQISSDDKVNFIDVISSFPEKIKEAVKGLNDTQLDTPYRPGGWTIRQVVHHCADSHMNALIRFKLALTENNPVITPYLQDKWAKLSDSISLPVESSLRTIQGIHARWTTLLQSMQADDYKKAYFHPEKQRLVLLEEAVASYAWHCRHHLAHILNCSKANNW